jgi:hypothetical protein
MNAVVKTAAIPFLKKITPKTVTEAQKINLLALNRPVPAQVLYDLFGTINGYKQKADDKTDKGMWTQFKGRFRAVAPSGEMWESGATHIPVLEDMILATLQAAKELDPRSNVEVALRIAIVPASPTKPSMTGYEYDVQRLLPAVETATDPIVLLMQAAAKANPPQLAGSSGPVQDPPQLAPAGLAAVQETKTPEGATDQGTGHKAAEAHRTRK